MTAGAREFDLIVFGATGFTGRLVAEYLHLSGAGGARWAIAGRSLDKLAEVRDLQQVAPAVDVALFPVDRRMGRDYMRGPLQFVERIKTRIFVPMHFSEDYEGGNAFRAQAEANGCRFLAIDRRGQRFDI